MKTFAPYVYVFLAALAGPAWVNSAACATSKPAAAAQATLPTFIGTVADTSGAIIPGAQVNLLDAGGHSVAAAVTDGSGSFRLQPPRGGDYVVSVSLQGFQTATQAVHAGGAFPPALSITLKIAKSVEQVTVNASTSVDLTSSDTNGDTSVMTSTDLKDLPVFDNDYVSAMGAFLDSGDTATAGTGLMVDGVEANRAMVSPSAVQEVHINQDPYSARYYARGGARLRSSPSRRRTPITGS